MNNDANHRIIDKKVNVILPMRAGSQRIVNKNTRMVNGMPLYEYIIEAILRCNHVDKIIINTDVKEVLDKYKNNEKFILLERPEYLRENRDMNKVIEDTLKKIKGDHFIQMHVTTPLLTKETIDKSVEEYFKALENNYDSLFSVTERQMRFFDKNWNPINHKRWGTTITQEIDPWYEENCILYLFSRDSFMKKKHRIGESPFLFKTPLIESVDLDTEEEFKMVELLLKGKSVS